jgi:hypothetical protein
VAQQVFDSKFLLAFAPDAPQFFLVPGDNQVTVLWRPSGTDAATPGSLGDPFFEIASSPMVTPEGGGATVVNSLYDPNYRQFDVEGYRVYRGRVDAPQSLTLLAQFDYSGTSIKDFSGFVNPTVGCAPDISIFAGCPSVYDPAEFQPGVARTGSVDVPLVGPIVQVKTGQRAALGTGVLDTVVSEIDSITTPGSPDTTFAVVFVSEAAQILAADTAVTGGGTGFPTLSDNGVPFVYVDNTVRNNFRYFYSVTAFDVNSFASGPSSIESARITKSVTPRVVSTNFATSGEILSSELHGRNGVLNTAAPLPTIDPTTGTFSGPFPAADGWEAGIGAFATDLLNGEGAMSVRLDSLKLGSPYDGIAHTYYFTAGTGVQFTSSVLQTQEVGIVVDTANFRAVNVDQQRAALYGGSSEFTLPGQVVMKLTGPDYAGLWGRGCVNNGLAGREGFGVTGAERCEYNGSRWFAGPSPENNETQADPNAGNVVNNSTQAYTDWNNSGALPGVVTIFQPQAYQDLPNTWRNVNAALSGARRAADFNVYWGTGGKIDSVIDISNDVVVPFDTTLAGSWGILNPGTVQPAGASADNNAALTTVDFQCIEPLFSYHTGAYPCPTTTPAPFKLSDTAVPGTIAFFKSTSGGTAPAPVARPNNGFGMYLSGDIFLFELQGGALPAAGTVWSLRSYIGGITGGHGAAGDGGPYAYNNTEPVRPLTSVGSEIQVTFRASNVSNAPTLVDLDRVHTVPDPYYITNEFEQSTDVKILKFVNLPSACTIRIYSSSGILVDVIEHNSTSSDGTETWDLQNRNHQVVASGVYFYHIEAGDARRVGRFTVVNFAQ